jgi:hypothetical protein
MKTPIPYGTKQHKKRKCLALQALQLDCEKGEKADPAFSLFFVKISLELFYTSFV